MMRAVLIHRPWRFILPCCLAFWSCRPGGPAGDAGISGEEGPPLFALTEPENTGIDFANTLAPEDFERNIYTFNYLYNGGGVAAGDLDGDGLPELFFTGNDVPNRLYRNRGGMRFEDVTEASGILNLPGWHTGVQMADVNGDGHLDIYICRGGMTPNDVDNRNLLYINRGDGRFDEMAEAYGIADPGYSIDAVFFDLDNDGDLDLYVTNRPATFSLDLERIKELRAARDFREEDQLYRNDGNGKFSRISREAGIANNFGFGLSVTAADLNGDGYQDLYVANDFLESDYLYINRGDGSFEERSKELLGHVPFYAMGTDIMDINNDGWEDIFTAEMLPEDFKRSKTSMAVMNVQEFNELIDYGMHHQYMHNMLQLNRGRGIFSEIAQFAGVDHTDWSWSCLLADFDNDGMRDLFVANGYKRDVYDNDADARLREWERRNSHKPRTQELLNEYLSLIPSNEQVNHIYRNLGDLKFEKHSERWGFRKAGFSNGATAADLDGDGDLDLVVNNLDAIADVYENRAELTGRRHLRVKLQGPPGNSAGLGSKIRLRAGDRLWFEQLKVSRGYQSSAEPVAHFGVDSLSRIDEVRVEWHDGSVTKLLDVKTNRTVTLDYADAVPKSLEPPQKTWLAECTDMHFDGSWQHRENSYDDYREQVLLPHKMSEFGPCLAVGDVNGDGLDDLFAGGAAGQPGQLFTQKNDGRFVTQPGAAFEEDRMSEDLGACFADIDGDGDLDLFVVSGGTEQDDPRGYSDRLYLNDGTGRFSRSDGLPPDDIAGSCVVSADFNGDGHTDFFVGGRNIPDKYPYPAKSRLLINDGTGGFEDRTSAMAPQLAEAGMVTKALVADIDGDGAHNELVITGEWMDIRIFRFDDGLFTETTQEHFREKYTGWWFGLHAADIDGDGDTDLLAGNLGLNYKFQASPDKPFHIYCDDFDGNGSWDIVLAKHIDSELFPVRGRQCSSDQMPFIRKEFPTFAEYAEANIRDILGSEIGEALHYEATHFASGVFENTPDGFVFHPFPTEAQLAPIQDFISLDVNNDGFTDILATGNFYQSERETTRADASIGVTLLHRGAMRFETAPYLQSGWFTPGDTRHIRPYRCPIGQCIAVATNKGRLRSFCLHKHQIAKK